MRIAPYAAQELKTDFLKQAPIGEVAPEHFRLNYSQAKCAEDVAGGHIRGGGADTFAPGGTTDDDSKLCTTLCFGCIVGPIAPTLSVALVALAACHSDHVHADRR